MNYDRSPMVKRVYNELNRNSWERLVLDTLAFVLILAVLFMGLVCPSN